MTLPSIELRRPALDDGRTMWHLAANCGLDVNSPYHYLVFCRDFTETSVVATTGDRTVGFVTGYLRGPRADTLFVWQVAVDPVLRRRGIALAMLTGLCDRLSPTALRFVEASVTPANSASARLFRAFAVCFNAQFVSSELFGEALFPAGSGHEAEVLLRIGPLRSPAVSEDQRRDAMEPPARSEVRTSEELL